MHHENLYILGNFDYNEMKIYTYYKTLIIMRWDKVQDGWTMIYVVGLRCEEVVDNMVQLKRKG